MSALEYSTANGINPDFDFSQIDNAVPENTDVSTLPIWALPDELQEVVKSVADGYQCSRDFCVASMFVAASSLIGKDVSSKFDNHLNYATLWIAIVGNSSSGKTAPIKFFFDPITKYERESFARYKSDIREWEESENKTETDKPQWRHLILNNPTDESVLHELAINGNACWIADEIVTIFGSWGKFSKGSSAIVGNLLSIYNNVDVSITRATKDPEYLQEPNLNIIGGIQPDILKNVMGKGGYTANGLFQRFLYAYPDESEMPMYVESKISEHVKMAWSDTAEQLRMCSQMCLQETETAHKLHFDTINKWRMMCNDEYKGNEVMISCVRKLEVPLCRWSIVTAVLSGKNVIDDDVVRYSAECMNYFRLCAEKAFCTITNDKEQKPPERAEIFKLLYEYYPDLNQSALGKALGISQQAVSKFLK